MICRHTRLASLFFSIALGLAAGCGRISLNTTDGGVGGAGGSGGSGGGGGAGVLAGVDVTPALASIAQSTSVDFRATARFTDGSTTDVTGAATWSSSNRGIAAMVANTARGGAPGSATITASYMGKSGTATLTVTSATLKAITVDPAGAVLPVSTTLQFHATGLFSDGSKQDLTTQVGWASGAPSVATVTTGAMGGLATGVKAGTTTITATLTGITGSTPLTVTAAMLKSIGVTPLNPILPVKVSQAFTATGVYSDGTRADLTPSAMWSSSDASVVALATGPGAAGQATTLAAGTSIVSASFGGMTGSSLVTVTKATLAAIKVAPASATVPRGATQAFTATGTYSDGSSVDVTTSVAWASDNTTVAAVSNAAGSEGVATALGAGGAVISATSSGVTGSAKMTVTDVTLTAVTVSPKSGSVSVGGQIQLTATATYSDGSSKDVTASAAWTSSDGGTASVSNAAGSPGRVTGLKVGSATITATLAGRSGSAFITVTSATLIGIVVTPASANLTVGGKQSFAAAGKYSDGSTVDITTRVTWSTDDPTVAGVSNAPGSQGLVIALALGKTPLRAALDGQEGVATVAVTDSGLKSLFVSPLNPMRHVGEGVQFTATGGYSDGTSRNLTQSATWSSSDTGVAIVGTTMMTAGQVRCLKAGTVTITAAYMGQSDSTTLTCTDPTITDLQVTPFMDSVGVGGMTLFMATAIFSDGTSRDVSNAATWKSSDTTIATVTSTGGRRGVAVGRAGGTVTITASYMGLSATATLTVTSSKVVALQVTPAGVSLRVGQTQQYQAVVIYDDGTNQNVTFQVAWTSGDTSIADVSSGGGGPGGPGGPGGGPGRATAIAAGTTAIKATYMGFSDSVTLIVTAPKLTGISVTPAAQSITIGQDLQYQAVALFDDGTNQNVTGPSTWMSSDTKVADVSNGFGMRGVATGLAAGTTTITASYMGFTDSVTLTVSAATLTELQVTPAGATVQKGTTQQYQAVALYSDGTSRNVTGAATWTSSNDMVMSMSNGFGSRGDGTALSPGTAQITATYMGLTASVGVTVSDVTILEIQVTPMTPTVPKGAEQAFVATVVYSDYSTKNVTAEATWTSDNTMVAAVSNGIGSKGRATALAVGSANITATWNGANGSTSMTVTAATIKDIQVTPVAPSSPLGVDVQFQATVVLTDGTSYGATGMVTWASSDTSVASVSNAGGSRGLGNAVKAGSVTISATLAGSVGTTVWSIGSQKLLSIAVTPANASIPKGATQSYTAMGLYDDMSTYDLTTAATWVSTATSVAGISNVGASKGLATGVATGMTVIEAHFGGITGSTGLTVTP